MILLHYARPDQRLMFAATCIFKINGATITTTIPQSLDNTDVVVVWRRYQSLMANERSVDQYVYRACLNNQRWQCETTPLTVQYVDGRELLNDA